LEGTDQGCGLGQAHLSEFYCHLAIRLMFVGAAFHIVGA
jgi:hypothetical protein